MKYKLFIPLIIVILVSLACGVPSSTPTPEPPTSVPTQPPPPTPVPTKAPTATRAPTATKVELPPTEEVSQVEAPAYYTEEFDIAGAPNWLYYVVSGSPDNINIYTDNGKLIFELADSNSQVNFLYDPYIYTDVQLDTVINNRGTNNYYYGIVTRYTEAEGFYLFLVNPGGLYGIWRYDAPTDTYYQIRTGGSASVRQGKDSNEITAITKGEKLELIINGKSIWTATDKVLREGQIGVTLVGLGSSPLKAEFEYVDISEP